MKTLCSVLAILGCLSVSTPFFADDSPFALDDPSERMRATAKQAIIPDYIDYQAPQPLSRAHSVGDAPPVPEFYFRERVFREEEKLAELKWTFHPAGMWIGEGKIVHSKCLTWAELKALAGEYSTPQRITDKQLSDEIIDGRRVLILDYRAWLDSGAPWPCFYVSRIWIPVDRDIVLQGSLVCSSAELRKLVRDSFRSIQIKKYYELE